MATASTRPPHPRPCAVQGCWGGHTALNWAPSRTKAPRPANAGGLGVRNTSLGGFFPVKQHKQEDPSLRCPELLPRWAPQCGGVWGGVPPRRGVPSGMCVFTVASQQPGSISLGVEAFLAHINSQQKLTPTRTAFIPTNYLCCGAAIKHSCKSSVMRNLHSTLRCLLSPSLSPCQLPRTPSSPVLLAWAGRVLLTPGRACTGAVNASGCCVGTFLIPQSFFQGWEGICPAGCNSLDLQPWKGLILP